MNVFELYQFSGAGVSSVLPSALAPWQAPFSFFPDEQQEEALAPADAPAPSDEALDLSEQQAADLSEHDFFEPSAGALTVCPPLVTAVSDELSDWAEAINPAAQNARVKRNFFIFFEVLCNYRESNGYCQEHDLRTAR